MRVCVLIEGLEKKKRVKNEKKNKKDFGRKKTLPSIFIFVNYSSGLIYLPAGIVLPCSSALQFIRVYMYINVCALLYSAPPTSVVHNRNVFFCCYLLFFFSTARGWNRASLPTSHNISVCWDPNHTLILRWKQRSLHECTDRALIRRDVQYYYVTYIVIILYIA